MCVAAVLRLMTRELDRLYLSVSRTAINSVYLLLSCSVIVAYYKTVCAEIKHKGNKRCDMTEEETGKRSLKTEKNKINKAKRGNMKRKRVQINSEMGAEVESERRKDNERKSTKNEGGENWVKKKESWGIFLRHMKG